MKAFIGAGLVLLTFTRVAMAVNSSPDPTMVFPQNNDLFRETFGTISLRARVTDSDGTITNVQFFLGTNFIGNGTPIANTDEFGLSYGPLGQGNYSFSVIGFDNEGASKNSWPSHISIATNAPAYALIDLQASPSGFAEEARGLNNSGEVVGFFNSVEGRRGFRHHDWVTQVIEAARSTDIVINAIADDSTVAGAAFLDGAYRPFIYSDAAGYIDLGSSGQATPLAIGRAGVVGFLNSNLQYPFYWDRTNFITLPTLGGWQSEASAINNQGDIVGWSYRFQLSDPRAFIHSNGEMHELEANSDDPNFILTAAYGINDAGHIVGSAGDFAFLYQNGHAKKLGVLGAAHVARDINESGVVVGNYSHELRDAGFIYHEGVMINLDKLIPAASGYHIARAAGINDRGEIAVTAFRPGTVYPGVACRLSPQPVQRVRRNLDSLVTTVYPLPGTVIEQESTNFIDWRALRTNTVTAARYESSDAVEPLKPAVFRRVVQPR